MKILKGKVKDVIDWQDWNYGFGAICKDWGYGYGYGHGWGYGDGCGSGYNIGMKNGVGYRLEFGKYYQGDINQ